MRDTACRLILFLRVVSTVTTSMCARQASVQFSWTRQPKRSRRSSHSAEGTETCHNFRRQRCSTFWSHPWLDPVKSIRMAINWRHEAELGCFTWFDREPSASTPPDGGRMPLSFNNAQFQLFMGHMTIDESAQ